MRSREEFQVRAWTTRLDNPVDTLRLPGMFFLAGCKQVDLGSAGFRVRIDPRTPNNSNSVTLRK